MDGYWEEAWWDRWLGGWMDIYLLSTHYVIITVTVYFLGALYTLSSSLLPSFPPFLARLFSFLLFGQQIVSGTSTANPIVNKTESILGFIELAV